MQNKIWYLNYKKVNTNFDRHILLYGVAKKKTCKWIKFTALLICILTNRNIYTIRTLIV
jgi:hypothetical protein